MWSFNQFDLYFPLKPLDCHLLSFKKYGNYISLFYRRRFYLLHAILIKINQLTQYLYWEGVKKILRTIWWFMEFIWIFCGISLWLFSASNKVQFEHADEMPCQFINTRASAIETIYIHLLNKCGEYKWWNKCSLI